MGVLIYLLTIAVQIICVVHVVRTGREKWWILLIIFVPLIGVLAYFFVELLPSLVGNRRIRHARQLGQMATQRLDPDKELRLAKDALEMSDTIGSRSRLADALAARGDYDAAIAEYRIAMARPGGGNDGLRFKYVQALFENGQGAEALREIDLLPPANVTVEKYQRKLLKARIYDFLGQHDEAAQLYEEVVAGSAGVAAQCHYAAMLMGQGNDAAALPLLHDVVKITAKWDGIQIGADRPMIDWARREYKRLST